MTGKALIWASQHGWAEDNAKSSMRARYWPTGAGVGLTRINGLSLVAVKKILTEIGPNLGRLLRVKKLLFLAWLKFRDHDQRGEGAFKQNQTPDQSGAPSPEEGSNKLVAL